MNILYVLSVNLPKIRLIWQKCKWYLMEEFCWLSKSNIESYESMNKKIAILNGQLRTCCSRKYCFVFHLQIPCALTAFCDI